MCTNYLVFVVVQVFLVAKSESVSDREYVSMPQLFHLDDFDRCMLYEDAEMLYCMITFQLKPIEKNISSPIWKIIQEVSSDSRNYRHDLLRHGICLPETCPDIDTNLPHSQLKEKISNCYNSKYEKYRLKGEITQIKCQTKDSPYSPEIPHFLFAFFSVVYISFVIFASIYEGISRYKTPEEYARLTETKTGEVIAAFALTRNWIRLKTVDFSDPEVIFFRPIQGVRFYNMLLVILMHTVMQNLALPVSNPRYVENLTDKTLNMFLANGGYAVQTSFMLSTLFLTYNFLKTFEKEKDIPIRYLIKAFLYRYIRLTPSLAVLVAFHSTWLVFLGRGPFWDEIVGAEYRRCRENGWSNILFVNNYVNPEEMCLPQTWYMASDTQFFIIALISIWIIKKNAKFLFLVVFSILTVHISALFFIIYLNNWESTIRPQPEYLYAFSVIKQRKWHIILGSNYSNAAGLPAGLILGYLFHNYKDKPFFNTKLRVTLWWIVVWGLSLGVVVIPGMIMYSRDYQHNRLYAAIFGSLSRTIFISGIGLALLGFCQRIGWLMKRTVEWYPTYVLGRVSYSAYLVHFSLIMVRSSSKRTLNHLADFTILAEFVSDIVIGYLAAFLLTLLIELPVSQLQKTLFTSARKKKIN